MIFIDRPPAPDFMIEQSGPWIKETQAAIAHYQAKIQDREFLFKLYRDARLKAELKKVFVKCAYCDEYYADVYDGDVEHFRPKGRVFEKNPQSPGYYWLANEWDNLFLSCQHCNQGRSHLLAGEIVATTLGKRERFPISDDTKRATRPGASIEEEEKVRLLINPCKDKPEEHFKYRIENGAMVALTEMGEVSMDIYALKRPMLGESRNRRFRELSHQIIVVKRELDNFNRYPSDENRKILESELDFLLEFTKRESPFAGMARFFVRGLLAENNLI